MGLIVSLVLLLVLVVFYIVARQRKTLDAVDALSNRAYRQRGCLFSPAERSFFGVLNQAVGQDCRVFGKVRVGDVLAPEEGLSTSERLRALNKINRMHFDFVLCSPDDLSVLCAIELDDKSHQQQSRRQRDAFLAEICRTAGLTLISFPAQHAYSVPDVASRIAELTKIQLGHTTAAEPRHVITTNYASSSTSQGDFQTPDVESAVASVSAPLCPRCSTPMLRRTAKAGDNAGQGFWGCSNFPACREVRPL